MKRLAGKEEHWSGLWAWQVKQGALIGLVAGLDLHVLRSNRFEGHPSERLTTHSGRVFMRLSEANGV